MEKLSFYAAESQDEDENSSSSSSSSDELLESQVAPKPAVQVAQTGLSYLQSAQHSGPAVVQQTETVAYGTEATIMSNAQMENVPREIVKEEAQHFDHQHIEQKPLLENSAPLVQQEHYVEAAACTDQYQHQAPDADCNHFGEQKVHQEISSELEVQLNIQKHYYTYGYHANEQIERQFAQPYQPEVDDEPLNQPIQEIGPEMENEEQNSNTLSAEEGDDTQPAQHQLEQDQLAEAQIRLEEKPIEHKEVYSPVKHTVQVQESQPQYYAQPIDIKQDHFDDTGVPTNRLQTEALVHQAAKVELSDHFNPREQHAEVILEERLPEEKADQAENLAQVEDEQVHQQDILHRSLKAGQREGQTSQKVELLESEGSELDQQILHNQDSDPDFSDDEQQKQQENQAFEAGSDDSEEIEIRNPILFTEHQAVMGRVPMMFFLPDVKESMNLKKVIEAHGGRCIEQFECSSYQIRTNSRATLDFNNFYKGAIYDEAWIRDSITLGILQNKIEYEFSINDSHEALRLNIGKRKRMTIVEGMKIYSLLGARKYDKLGLDTFQGIERQRYLPERSVDSMKSFWKEYSCKTLEEYLVEAIHFRYDYCLSFKEIPNEEFEAKHRKQFAYEFSLLANEDKLNHYTQQNLAYEQYGAIDDGRVPYGRRIHMDDVSDDSDDIFNDKVTEKIDKLNQSSEQKFSALDQLTSPSNFIQASQLNQNTGSTLLSSSLADVNQGVGSNPSMIDTTGGAKTRAFDTGLPSSQTEQRIDLSSLIDDGSKSATSQIPHTQVSQSSNLVHQMKQVNSKGLAGTKRTYSVASSNKGLIYTPRTRPLASLSALVENLNIKRFKTYAPRNNEVAEWSQTELARYFEIERMHITTSEKSFAEQKGFIRPKDYRVIVRRIDQVGQFKWIQNDLEEIANQYSKDLDDVLQIFEQVNCDKKRLREQLEGGSYCSWKKLDDLALKNIWAEMKVQGNGFQKANDPYYKLLLEEKGAAEIQARMKFLGYVM